MTDGPLSRNAFLLCRDTLTPCRIHISEPIGSDDDFYCLVRLPPVLNEEKRIFGADAAQAKELAIDFLKRMASGMSLVDSQGKALDWTGALGQ